MERLLRLQPLANGEIWTVPIAGTWQAYVLDALQHGRDVLMIGPEKGPDAVRCSTS